MIFSGTRISLSDTTIQNHVDRVYPPVISLLSEALFLTPGGEGKNYAPDGKVLPVTSGSTVQNLYSKSFPTINDCIKTGLLDNSDFTVLIVNKPTAMPSGMIYRPFFGNWNAAIAETNKGQGLGSGIVQGANSLNIIASSVPVSDAGNPSATTSIRENKTLGGVAYDGTWRFSALRITKNEIFFRDFTKGVELPSTPFTSGYVKDNRRNVELLLCGQYGADTSTCAPGPETALMLFYRRGLNASEMAAMYAWAQKYCSGRGITSSL